MNILTWCWWLSALNLDSSQTADTLGLVSSAGTLNSPPRKKLVPHLLRMCVPRLAGVCSPCTVVPSAGMAKGVAQYSLQLTLKAADYPLAEGLPTGCLGLEVGAGGCTDLLTTFNLTKNPDVQEDSKHGVFVVFAGCDCPALERLWSRWRTRSCNIHGLLLLDEGRY